MADPNLLQQVMARIGGQVRSGLNPRTAGGGFDWRQFLDVVSEPFVPGDIWNSGQGRWSTPMEAIGLDGLANMSNPFEGMFDRPGFTPAPGMGIMPEQAGPVQPPSPEAWVDGTPRFFFEEGYGEGYHETQDNYDRAQQERARRETEAKEAAERAASDMRTNAAISVSGLNATSGASERLNKFARMIAK